MIKQLSLAVVAVALIIVGVFAVIDAVNEEAQQERAAQAKEAATAPAAK